MPKIHNQCCNKGICSCSENKFIIIEHDFTKTNTYNATFSPCNGINEQTFGGIQEYYDNPLFEECDRKRIGFSMGTSVLTGRSSQLVTDLEPSLASGADFAYMVTGQFVFTWDTCHPYKAKDSITVQGPLYYIGNSNDAVPSTWAITGGTGKYKAAQGEVRVTDLGCQPLEDCSANYVRKYKYKFKVSVNCQ